MATRGWLAFLALMLAITVIVAVPLDTQARMRGAMGGGGGGVRQDARGPNNPRTMMGSGGMGTSGRMGPGTMTPPAQMGPGSMRNTGPMGPGMMRPGTGNAPQPGQ